MYAIVDIETTGGQIASGSITEIAIIVHDGTKEIDRFETLVRPFYHIPRHITMLTGIDDEMVAHSPTFEDIADKVYHLLKDNIFVAHNVNFDYSFLKHHLASAGCTFASPKLCTVRLSRKIFPGLRSYSLGNICAYLQINIENRHRAGGDADATVALFQLLLEHDKSQIIQQQLKRNSGEQSLPPNLSKSAIDQLPDGAGVYYFHNQNGKVIYIGKAKNIRKRVQSHFTGNKISKQRQDFLRDIYSISFESCATELMALVLEAIEIKKNWPKHNSALKGFEPKYGLFSYIDQQDLHRLFIGKYNKGIVPLKSFHDLLTARNFLQHWVNDYNLCAALCKVGDCDTCKSEEESPHKKPSGYNKNVANAIASLQVQESAFCIIDKGRHEEEQSIIWVEPGAFYAMGYLSLDATYGDPIALRQLLQPFEGSYYVLQMLTKFAKENPQKVKIIHLVE